MKNVFDCAKDVLQYKKPYQLSNEDDANFFMLQRICSMASPLHCMIVNEITNQQHEVFSDDEQLLYDYYRLVLPKHTKYSEYMKKTPSVPNKHKETILLIAREWNLSPRKVSDLIEINPNILKEFEEKAKMNAKNLA